MANFREVIESKRAKCEARNDPMILALLAGVFLNHGLNFRIVVPKLATSDESSTNMFVDILDELVQCGLVIRPTTPDKEEDDRAMLQLADRYGAVIISQDNFRNHYEEFGNLIHTNVIGYKNVRNDKFSIEILKERLTVERRFCLNANSSDFYAQPTDPQYAKVKKGLTKFPQINPNMHEKIGALNLFIHEYLCQVINFCRPNTEPVDFMRNCDDYVITSFSDFKDRHRTSLQKPANKI
uniref:RNase NYN domain-containing protein n=1 Tax=Panagrellus redivivus TaxID=6233 RepID=A0A7E4VA35_PANRE